MRRGRSPAGPATRTCPRCGRPLAPTAAFCRSCGSRYDEPAAASGGPPRTLLLIAVAIVLVGAGAAVAISLGNRDTNEPSASAAASAGQGKGNALVPGRYVQAGSFTILADAEAEQRRLARRGIEVEVLESDRAEELYPGFQVLLGGPLHSSRAAKTLLRRLHRDGVPSAFARHLEPAAGGSGYGAVAGRWRGSLEESSSESPGLDRTLPVTLTMTSDGHEGSLNVPALHCRAELTAVASRPGFSLTFEQSGTCVGSGAWHLRPSSGGLDLTLFPEESDAIVLGSLARR
jgi:hypothetical protein